MPNSLIIASVRNHIVRKLLIHLVPRYVQYFQILTYVDIFLTDEKYLLINSFLFYLFESYIVSLFFTYLQFYYVHVYYQLTFLLHTWIPFFIINFNQNYFTLNNELLRDQQRIIKTDMLFNIFPSSSNSFVLYIFAYKPLEAFHLPLFCFLPKIQHRPACLFISSAHIIFGLSLPFVPSQGYHC